MGKKTDGGSADTELDLIRGERTGLTDLALHGPMNVGGGKIKMRMQRQKVHTGKIPAQMERCTD